MHPDILGWTAAALMVATFSCREARHLRPLAVATNLAFVGYGAAAELMPVLALHLLLLPINLWRWAQVRALSREQLQQGAERLGRLLCAVSLGVLPLMAGCGGGGEDAPPPQTPPASTTPPTTPPTPPAQTIGTAGGTVSSADGAEVSVPPGALAGETPIAVHADAAGAPPLPAGLLALGKVYAFTPHGTTFAVPAKVTVPFDAAMVPAGVVPALYKADATGADAGQWREVAGATVNGAAMSAGISSFSHLVVAPPPTFVGIHRFWEIEPLDAKWDAIPTGRPVGHSDSGTVSDELPLGLVHLRGLGDSARGFVSSNATGSTYSLGVNAPAATLPGEPYGGRVYYEQVQFFHKREEPSTLRLTITEAKVMAVDFDPRPPCNGDDCSKRIWGLLDVDIVAYDEDKDRYFFVRNGQLTVSGTYDEWLFGPHSTSEVPLWSERHFNMASAKASESVLELRLLEPIRIAVPLDSVDIKGRFVLRTTVKLRVLDRRQRESAVEVYFRDPQGLGSGVLVEYTGLDRGDPHRSAPPPLFTEAAVACATGPNPAAGTLQFESATFIGDEGFPRGALVTVTRTGGTQGRVSARISTGAGTAVAGVHYQPVTGHVAFADGEDGRRAFYVPLLNDALPEADRNVPLLLDEARGCAALGTPTSATLTIVDDDRLPAPALAYRVGGTVNGLVGTGLLLEDRAQFVDLPIAANGRFQFTGTYAPGTAYDVRVKTPPSAPTQTCTVTRGSGVVGSGDVTDIAVDCVTPPPPTGLDLGFGAGTGKVTAGPVGVAKAIALLPDGRILAAIGNSVARYLADGTLDTTFGSNGSVGNVVGPTNFGAEILDLAMQADGRIVAAGTARGSSLSTLAYDFAAARLNADGSRDPTFNGGNALQVDWVGAPDRAARVLLQPDGRIVLAGQATTVYVPATGSQDSAMALVRLNADGSLDPTFGSGGRAVTSFGLLEAGQAAALQADGKIVIAGRVADNLADSQFGVARFNIDGTPDTSFGGAGQVRYNELADATALALQPDGRLVLALAHRESGNTGFGVVRLNADGSADTTFGAAGLARLEIGPGVDAPLGLALQADGRIVVVGSALNTATSYDFVVARLLPTGAADPGFGTGGIHSLDLFRGRDGAHDVLVQPDGKLLVSGSAGNGLSTLPLLMRFHP